MPATMPPVQMNGLRISGRQILLQQVFGDDSAPRPAPLYRMLAADRINISFLCANYLGTEKKIGCLVEPAGKAAASLVTIFPHRFNPAAAAAVFRALDRGDVRWHYMATSGSTLSFIIDYEDRKRAAKAIAGQIGFPASLGSICPGLDHDPIARSLKTSPETVARYVESRIRTYGIDARCGLALCSLHMPSEELEQWAGAMADKGFVFYYASAAGRDEKDWIMLEILLESGKKGFGPGASAFQLPVCGRYGSAEVLGDAEMISFHGPHFGDRYGIADKALGGLANAGVPVLLAGCVGATVSIILPPGRAKDASETLSDRFDMP